MEYGFGKCGQKIQTVLKHRPNNDAKYRADKIKEDLEDQFDLERSRPLTVLMVVYDSVSREHFYRNFDETLEYLNDELDEHYEAYDFRFNNVHGNNTLSNMIPLLYGHSLQTHEDLVRGWSYKRSEDDSVFLNLQSQALWKIFESYGFVTMFGYDTIYDFLAKATSRRVLTDHMFTNFWLHAERVYKY